MKTNNKSNSNQLNQKKDSIKSIKEKQVKSDLTGFPIVGIGASAGGLEALEQFFENMLPDSGMAFVVIQHLDPHHVGIMPELLQRITSMKVQQAKDRMKVIQNCVYVIPPNKSMSILKGNLHLFDPVATRGLRLPIDIFFRSLAEDRQEKSIGIILSGMGSDGSLGLKAIKEKNGVVLIQKASTAKFDGMPRSAAETVIADIIAPANELAAKLTDFLKLVPKIKVVTKIDNRHRSNLEKIIILLREQSGHDFSLYKKNTLLRRIERRRGVHQIESIKNYVRFLQENPKETEILFKELLIGVTSFFRDAEVWEMLKTTVIPKFIDNLPKGHVIRAWVAGCSSGEEAYTLAIIFKEIFENSKKHKSISLQIFATDLDNDAIEKARKGIFPANIINDVSPERLTRFFTVEGDNYKVVNSVREMIIFAPQSVIKDPPFTRLDFLSCRNMLIYMESELQNKMVSLFNYSLNPDGIMLLGTAETLGKRNDGFKELSTKFKIYKRLQSTSVPELINFPSSFYQNKTMTSEKLPNLKIPDNIQTLADQVLLQNYAPASVLVNDKGDILYITGHTGKYLEPAAGKANWNIYAMAREGLNRELLSALRKAAINKGPVIVRNIKIGVNGGSQFVDLTVQRLESPEMLKGMVIVIFADVPIFVEEQPTTLLTEKQKSNPQIKDLQLELQRSYEDLQSTREEMQTSQEELKSTNEELQSTNEELQSTNEELTTSKEEMQSLNEELQTVNIELQSKVNDFARANDDMKNLLNSIEIATLFLDKELNIRRFTDQITNIFKLRSADIGRPFTDLVSDLQYPEMEEEARQVIKTLISVEKAVETSNKRWFSIRIMPYRTIDDRIDGLVMTFTDITVAKKLEIELKKANESLKKTNNK